MTSVRLYLHSDGARLCVLELRLEDLWGAAADPDEAQLLGRIESLLPASYCFAQQDRREVKARLRSLLSSRQECNIKVSLVRRTVRKKPLTATKDGSVADKLEQARRGRDAARVERDQACVERDAAEGKLERLERQADAQQQAHDLLEKRLAKQETCRQARCRELEERNEQLEEENRRYVEQLVEEAARMRDSLTELHDCERQLADLQPSGSAGQRKDPKGDYP